MEKLLDNLLTRLHVEHSRNYLREICQTHPNRYNLLGISQILTHYGVDNVALKIDRDDLERLNTPFIADIFDNTGLVTDTGGGFVRVEGFKAPFRIEEFKKAWSGVVLLAEKNEKSGEPEYRKHRRTDRLLKSACLLLAVLFTVSTVAAAVSVAGPAGRIGFILLLALNGLGVFISTLLLAKQLDLKNKTADKVCKMIKENDCKKVINSSAGKISGLFSLSETGFAYFTANIAVLVFFPSLREWMTLLNIAALPFTLWSVLYQKFAARQWCILCLAAQAVIWLLFAVNISFGFIPTPATEISPLTNTLLLYAGLLLLTHFAARYIRDVRTFAGEAQRYNSLKTDRRVFEALLQTEDPHPLEADTTSIDFGNAESEMELTVLSNPFCNPCAQMHRRLDNLIKEHPGGFRIRYVLSAFNESLEDINRILIGVFMTRDRETALQILDEWYEWGKLDRDGFRRKYDDGFSSSEAVAREFERHKAWAAKNGLDATPTVIVNGHLLPENYHVEDLADFIV